MYAYPLLQVLCKRAHYLNKCKMNLKSATAFFLMGTSFQVFDVFNEFGVH